MSHFENKSTMSVMFSPNSIAGMKFPYKLWTIVNDCKTGAIQWSASGETILLDYIKFNNIYLKENSPFKTRNIASFVRQLNLYGFRKVTSHHRDILCNLQNPDIHEFRHYCFRMDKPELLSSVKRNAINAKILRRKREKYARFFKNQEKPSSKLLNARKALKNSLEKAAYEESMKQQLVVDAERILLDAYFDSTLSNGVCVCEELQWKSLEHWPEVHVPSSDMMDPSDINLSLELPLSLSEYENQLDLDEDGWENILDCFDSSR